MPFDKYADYTPLSNVRAQVKFWQMDLQQSINYLRKVESFEKYNLPHYDKYHRIAVKDVCDSEQGLLKAQGKLEDLLDEVYEEPPVKVWKNE